MELTKKPTRLDLTIVKGTSKTYELTFKTEGVAENITGFSVYFTVKTNMADADSAALINKTITTFEDGTNGIALIELTPTDTAIAIGNYWYSIDYKSDDGNIESVLVGRLTIEKPVRDTKG